MRVTIVGAGIAGLSTAWSLAKLGHDGHCQLCDLSFGLDLDRADEAHHLVDRRAVRHAAGGNVLGAAGADPRGKGEAIDDLLTADDDPHAGRGAGGNDFAAAGDELIVGDAAGKVRHQSAAARAADRNARATPLKLASSTWCVLRP